MRIKSNNALVNLIKEHCRRIAATLSYAIAQKNNHATSEAVGLFIGGHMLKSAGCDCLGYIKKGSKLLNRAIHELVLPDGSFSQHSVIYHRLFLDSVSCALEFDEQVLDKQSVYLLRQAVKWLHGMVNPINGRAPNLGANDGTCLCRFHELNYLDFRPTLQALSLQLYGKVYYPSGKWDDILLLLGNKIPEECLPPRKGDVYKDGGFGVIECGDFWVLLRMPKYLFRPSQSDALHLDVWDGATNLIRDGGSYSYNADRPTFEYFSGAESHSTVQFDDRPHMPRLGRFLFGRWLRPEVMKYEARLGRMESCYVDIFNNRHARSVLVDDGKIVVEDELSGSFGGAVLRWRLAPDLEWVLCEGGAICDLYTVGIVSEKALDIKLTIGMESLYYNQKSEIPVLEIRVTSACSVITMLERRG